VHDDPGAGFYGFVARRVRDIDADETLLTLLHKHSLQEFFPGNYSRKPEERVWAYRRL
jgi:hypothetical protein